MLPTGDPSVNIILFTIVIYRLWHVIFNEFDILVMLGTIKVDCQSFPGEN
jgi:hypothetical protein